MVLILDGNSDMVRTQEWKNPICDRSRSYQMPYTFQITKKLLFMCAPISELPYDISTKAFTKDFSEIKD